MINQHNLHLDGIKVFGRPVEENKLFSIQHLLVVWGGTGAGRWSVSGGVWRIVVPRVFSWGWGYERIPDGWLCTVLSLGTGWRGSGGWRVVYFVCEDHDYQTRGPTYLFLFLLSTRCWWIPPQYLVVCVPRGRSRGSGRRWHRRVLWIVYLTDRGNNLWWTCLPMTNRPQGQPWTSIWGITYLCAGPLWVAPFFCWLVLFTSSASADSEPAYSVASFGLSVLSSMLGRLLVLGVESVEVNVTKTSPGSGWAGTEVWAQTEELGSY